MPPLAHTGGGSQCGPISSFVWARSRGFRPGFVANCNRPMAMIMPWWRPRCMGRLLQATTLLCPTAERPKGWAELAPELGPQPLDHLITKHQWGAFFGTDLDLQLRRRGIGTIVLCGIATGFGIDTTAREAYQHGYNQVFAEDAMNALSEDEHHYVCTRIFPRMGRLRSTDEIV